MGKYDNLGGFWKPDPETKQALSRIKTAKWSKKRKKRQEKSRGRKNSGFSVKRWRLLHSPGRVFYRSKQWLALRIRVFATYGRSCMKCRRADGIMHVDHIKPRSKYPELSLEFDNMQVLCESCNQEKSNWHDTDYRESAAEENLDIAALRDLSETGYI